MKRTYLKPTIEVIQIQHTQQLLSGSPYDNQNGPLETYDEDEDVINDIKGIW